MRTPAIDRLGHLATTFKRYGQSQQDSIPATIKDLAANAGGALAAAVKQVKLERDDIPQVPGLELQHAFARMLTSFMNYLRELKEVYSDSYHGRILSNIFNHKLAQLKHTDRPAMARKADEVLDMINSYNFDDRHPMIQARIERIKEMLKWFQEGHASTYLEKEFGIKKGQIRNYISQTLGTAGKRRDPAGIIANAASRDVQGTRHNYAKAKAEGKTGNLKRHVRFLERIEEALAREDLSDLTKKKLSSMREYALAGVNGSTVKIGRKYGVSHQSIFDWVDRWNTVMGEKESKGTDGVKRFFPDDWPDRPKPKAASRTSNSGTA
ncbi:MAG: hypothetical protein OXU45_03775 [Candidatus Melainabacteria bacterium]|nr:hypothetical protein [Candidatus Melainabacteria bacterium]